MVQEQEAKTPHSKLAQDALTLAQELCAKATGSSGTRQSYFLGRLMAKELLVSGDTSTAHKLLMLVAGQDSTLICIHLFG